MIKNKNAFSLTELMVSTVVALFVLLGAWAIYTMGWTWWHEVSPRIEAQRITRLALANIIQGISDSTAGFDVIGTGRYNHRNGIAGAMWDPVISLDSKRIDFGLEADRDPAHPTTPHNDRAFYLGTNAATGKKVVVYKNDAGALREIDGTLGITNLRFDKYIDANNKILIKVTATTDKTVSAIGRAGQRYTINVQYIDYAYLRNAQ